jgi:CHAD domain-containing protein
MHRTGLSPTGGNGTVAARERTLCRFAAERLAPRVRAFVREIDGVRKSANPDHVHWMRVASRRLRSALPLFSSCFIEKKYRRWMNGIKAITAALGSARDTDVQILFLESYAQEHPPEFNDGTGIPALIDLLREQRARQQKDVLAALEMLETGNTAGEITAALRELSSRKKMKDGRVEIPSDLYQLAAGHIGSVLDGLLDYNAALQNPDNADGHHKARIAAKKLRYTLEVYRPIYPDRLKSFLGHIKKLQESLGMLHDCDVWAQFLTQVVADRHRVEAVQDTPGPNSPGTLDSGTDGSPVEPDVVRLLLDRKQKRDVIYRELVATWEECKTRNVWERLRIEINSAAEMIPAPELLEAKKPKEHSLDPVHALAGSFPEGEGHAHQVTRLALMLFDDLAVLHRYSGDERFLLECAGLLHDIGWAFGQQGHHTRSFSMILDDRTLPLSDRERMIIALIARYHRKSVPGAKDEAFASLKPKDKKIVRTCSALLRVADGLDFTHSNRISSLTCTIFPDAVTCRLQHEGDIGVETARAVQKADLFMEVFSRRLVFA